MIDAAGGNALDLVLDGASPAGVDAARRRVLAHLEHEPSFQADARRIYGVELVLEEWLTNAFGHGAAAEVALRVAMDGTDLLLQFSDDGQPFDATAQAPAARPASLDEAEPGGLGLMLIQRYARRWQHTREGERNMMRVWL